VGLRGNAACEQCLQFLYLDRTADALGDGQESPGSEVKQEYLVILAEMRDCLPADLASRVFPGGLNTLRVECHRAVSAIGQAAQVASFVSIPEIKREAGGEDARADYIADGEPGHPRPDYEKPQDDKQDAQCGNQGAVQNLPGSRPPTTRIVQALGGKVIVE